MTTDYSIALGRRNLKQRLHALAKRAEDFDAEAIETLHAALDTFREIRAAQIKNKGND